jgi:signal transduction histidine kinase
VAAALLVAGVAIVLIFAASVQRDMQQDLMVSLDRLIAGIDATGQLSEIDPRLGDPRYAAPAGGRYWQVADLETGELAQSRSLWGYELPILAPPAAGAASLTELAGPEGQVLSVLTRDIMLDTGADLRGLRLSVAEDTALRSRDIRQFSIDIAVALLAVGAALLLAGWLQVHLGLRPLGRLRRAVEDVARGRVSALDEDYPMEVLPLVREVNALLASHEQSIRSARTRADDLAHGLKTPLAVLNATASRLRARGDDANATVLDLLSDEMAERIDYQLRLAQLRVRSADRMLQASLDQALIRSVAVLSKTGRGADLFWQLKADRVSVDMDSHDLMELVGVLLENASKWARSQVEVACRAGPTTAEFEIRDDGPGLTEEEIARLGPRGKRLDEQRSGSGFGIAIAREILGLNGGTMEILKSDLGGLRVVVSLPRAADDQAA